MALWAHTEKSDTQIFLSEALWHWADHLPSVCPHFSPFIRNLRIRSCVLNPGLDWFFKDLKIEAPVPHQASPEATASPYWVQTAVRSPLPK